MFLRMIACVAALLTADVGHAFVPDGQCAVVVASRASMGEVRDFINGADLPAARVFHARNGWFAIVREFVPSDLADARIARLKAQGLVPSDAYCSTGSSYLREVEWSAGRGAPPVDGSLWAEFDARPLWQPEKRFLQIGLALSGDYNGRFDGEWGRGSQGALERWSAREFDGAVPLNGLAALLAMTTAARLSDEGWDYRSIPHLALSALLPWEMMRLEDIKGPFRKWRHLSVPLTVYANDLGDSALAEVHDPFLSGKRLTGEPYYLRRSGLWVTSYAHAGGTTYIRSALISGTWSTLAVEAGLGLDAALAAIAGSITPGDPPRYLPRPHGVLMTNATALSDEIARNEAATPGSRPDLPEASTGGSGTAFYISGDGLAMTNAHVVEGCGRLALDGRAARVVAISPVFDLAVVTPIEAVTVTHLRFAPEDARLNSDITVAGFPLQGTLGGLNISRGSVSALRGMGGDETNIQISAPVQPGNSGGPAIDRMGAVVGVVVSKLSQTSNPDIVADNIGFAIRGSVARTFMSANGIAFDLSGDATPLAPEDAADHLAAATVTLICD